MNEDPESENENESLLESPLSNKRAGVQARRVLFFAITLFVLVDVVMVGMGPMFVRMEELSICRSYYFQQDPSLIDDDGNVEETLCKVDAVQAELAFISGWLGFFETIPGVLLGIFFGRLADIKGRKFVFLINLVPLYVSTIWISVVCYFFSTFPDPKSLWLSSLGYFVGGGPQMLGTMLLAMIADVTPEFDRAKAFVFVAVSQLIVEFFLAEVGAFLLAKDLYLPLQIGLPIAILAIPTMLLMPETLSSLNRPHVDFQALPTDDGQSSTTTSPPVGQRGTGWNFRIRFWNYFDALFTCSSLIFSGLWRKRKILIIFLVFFVGVLDRGTFAHVLQYISKKFLWKIAEAGVLAPVVSAFRLLILVIAVPFTMQFLRRRRWETDSIDSFIVTFGLIGIAIGNSIVAICSTWQQLTFGLFISAFGCAISPSLRSTASNLVPNTSLSHLYSSITVVQMVARLVVGPVFAYGFKAGLTSGVLGLPFLIVAAAHFFAAFMYITYF
ncbi:major facilitator superfamily domain-containing protein [Amylocarpus encephaloides]|uniref:Major facilitator superfamily domain-containing protein n=1 Tax=Amylocarpus encephaloides TaxID=45428 RepID=A0A9P7YB67_9HELO|nr:major facilitator superfamily domain-containing protein [Amylocarpus encephaloides]